MHALPHLVVWASELPQGEVGGFPKHFLGMLILVLLCTTIKSSVFYLLLFFNHSLLTPQPLATSNIAYSARLPYKF